MKRSTGRIVPLSDLIRRVTSGIEDTYHNRPSADLFSTGFRSLDDLTRGFHRGDLVAVLSDIPDIATAFLLSSVHSLVSRDRVASLFVSARHDESYVVTKLLSIESGIRYFELRSAVLDTVHRSALTASANALYDARLRIASIDAVTQDGFIDTLAQSKTETDNDESAESVFIDTPIYHQSDELVLRRLRDTATNRDRPIVVSSRATPEQWDERRFDRWFDTFLRLIPAEVDAELIQVEVLQNRHGTVGSHTHRAVRR